MRSLGSCDTSEQKSGAGIVTYGCVGAALLCGALVSCGGSPLPHAPEPRALSSAAEPAPNSPFAPNTESPRPVIAPPDDPSERALRDACGEADAALNAVATQLAERRTDADAELDVESIRYALRSAGVPYVWPRAWLFTGSEGELETAKARMQRWLGSFADGGSRRCGVSVRHEGNSRMRAAAVAVDVLADLEPLPTRARIGQWLEVRATLRVPASDAKLVVLGPRGAPHAVPTSFDDGRVRARFNADSPGQWLVQLLGSVEGGPRPLLEALVFAGGEPPAEALVDKAPGEDAADPEGDPRAALYAMVNAARASEHSGALARDARLELLAQTQAEAMRRLHKTAHDVGDGDLNQRLERAGLELSAGENVAHAASAALAQRLLWASPSHRENLLFRGFDALGIGVARDADGTLWVCQVFATTR
ncbi:MAG TPA: CAP domain-containing protein [Polyangiaceae bacterium]|nr:CAP domain-containing protein [Polyangiaceae bacterium]